MIDITVFIALGVKILVLVGIGVYGIFAGIMVRQVDLMASVLEQNFTPLLRLLAVIHLFLTGVVFLCAIFLV